MSRSSIVLCLVVALLALCIGQVQAAVEPRRSYVRDSFFLILDNMQCGFVHSAEGGAISGEVINEPAGPGYFVKKHIGQPQYEDITLEIGFGMAIPVYEWIKRSWDMSYARRDGSIVACGFNLDAQSEIDFFHALIAETTIPACDGASKDPGHITLRLDPEYTIRPAVPTVVDIDKPPYGTEQKLWLPCNFRLAIDGLDCTRVNKIDSFTVKQTIVGGDIGEPRDYEKAPVKLEFPNLRITLSESSAQSWIEWHKSFVIEGNNDESKERSGTLTFLSPNLQTELARITFHNLGIFRLEPAKAEAGSDQIRRIRAELYCERMEFDYNKNK